MNDKTLEQKIERDLDVDPDDVENRVRLAAFGIWEEEGKPDGRAEQHWHEAQRRLHADAAADKDPAGPSKGAVDGRPTTGADSTARPSRDGKAAKTPG